jgi:uncharacterized membrane protein YfcA
MGVLFEETVLNWVLVSFAAFIIGLSKSGIKGIEMINITVMAIVFGGKASTGVVLPLLCLADIMAVKYYHRHAQWNYFWKLLPWLVAGILLGVFIGKDLDETIFRKIMAVIIILTVAIMLLLEVSKNPSIPNNKFFAAGMGLIAGFTTMLGNLGGAFSNIYFLATKMVKNDFIGTAAWIFLVINFFKLPFQVIYWKNITAASLRIDLFLIPPLIAGFFAGLVIVAKINEKSFRRVVFVLTIIGAGIIFFKR